MADQPEISEEIQRLQASAKDIGEQMREAASKDETRYGELKAQLDKVSADLNEQHAREASAAREAEAADRIKRLEDQLSNMRTPSKADLIGAGRTPEQADADLFFANVAKAKSRDYDEQTAAKAALAMFGSQHVGADPNAKATLGTSDATGGYVVPNDIVNRVITTPTPANPYRELMTTLRLPRGSGAEQPIESIAAARAAVVARGATKPNRDVTLPSYTATLYTIAVIYDVANQLLRQSAGAAEQLIRTKGIASIVQGESYYILNGSGTSEPKGLLTSLGTSGTFVTSHTAANDTVVGSAAAAIAKAAGALADRNRTPGAVVMNAGNYWTALAQGSADAGFFLNPAGGPNNITGFGPWGLRVIPDANMPADSLVVGEFSSAILYIGEDLRVDTSDEAGDRWDKNLTGFRFEEEIAFNADPFVAAGAFQRIIDAVA
jgi:HK97 family phage major capsid protein